MSRTNLIRLTLFRLLALIIMLAVIAGSFYVHGMDTQQDAAIQEPEPSPEQTAEPTSEPVYPLIDPDAVPPASASDLEPMDESDDAPGFISADGTALSYAWGESVPASTPTDNSWFEDTAFIGNSLCDGLMLFGDVDGAHFYSAQSITVQNIYTNECINAGGGEYITIIDALEREQYGKIYIMLGINEIFRGGEWFSEHYSALIDHLRQTEPGAELYIQAILPVTEEKSASGYYNRENVLSFNEQLIDLCREKEVFYLDLFNLFADEEGYLPLEFSSDGVHLNRTYYLVWSDYLRDHTITEVTQ